MDQLPYELLQLISNSLLPRSQCRLALASKHCYLYIYTDLLRWHAKWALNKIPKYKNTDFTSIIQVNKKIVMYEDMAEEGLYAFNLTKCEMTDVDELNNRSDIPEYTLISIFRLHRNENILKGCYKYMHTKCINYHMKTRNLFTSLPLIIMYRIYAKLSGDDRTSLEKTCYYISWLMSV